MTNINRSISPKISLIGEVKIPFFSVEKLKNGIPVYFINSNNTEISEISFLFNKGIWNQDHLLEAAFTSKIITEGTQKQSSKEIYEIFDFCGANFSKDVTLHSSFFRLSALDKFLPQLIKIISDMFKNPLFDNAEFELLRTKFKQRYIIDLEEVETIAYNNLNRMLFGKNHPYGWAATVEDYDNLQLDWLKKYFQNNYLQDNLSIIAVSKQKQMLLDVFNECFSDLNKNNKILNEKKYEIISEEKHAKIEKKGSYQAAVRVGWKMFDRTHEDYIDMLIVDTLLGGYFGSRLMQNIREKLGLTYSIYSSFSAYRYGGMFQISSEVNLKNKLKVIDEIKKEVLRIQKENITNDELTNMQNYMMGALLRTIDGTFNFGRLILGYLTYEIDFDFIEKYSDRIKNITPERIKYLANKHLDIEKMYSVIVG